MLKIIKIIIDTMIKFTLTLNFFRIYKSWLLDFFSIVYLNTNYI